MKQKTFYELWTRVYSQNGYNWNVKTFSDKKELEKAIIELDNWYGDMIKIIEKTETETFFGYIDDVFTPKNK